jgi:hypothetical protein
MSTPSPDEARDALARVSEVRLNTTESRRTPWWLWVAVGVVVALLLAVNDFGSTAQDVVGFAFAAIVVVWIVATRRSPRFAAATGSVHRSAYPGYVWMPVLLIGLVDGIVQYFANPAVHRMLTGSGMPAWIREHPNTTEALPYAVFSVAVGLLINVVVRRTARRAAL